MIQEIAWYLIVFLCFVSIGKTMAMWGKKDPAGGTYGWSNVTSALLVLALAAIVAGKFGAM